MALIGGFLLVVFVFGLVVMSYFLRWLFKTPPSETLKQYEDSIRLQDQLTPEVRVAEASPCISDIPKDDKAHGLDVTE